MNKSSRREHPLQAARRQIIHLERIADSAMQVLEGRGLMTEAVLPAETVAWWGERKEFLQAEAQKAEIEAKRQGLIAAMSPEEREILGLEI